MDLIDEENSRYKLSNTLIDVPVYNFINFPSKFISDLSLFWFHDLSHQAHEIISSLWLSIGHVQIMESNILNDLLLFVYVSFW